MKPCGQVFRAARKRETRRGEWAGVRAIERGVRRCIAGRSAYARRGQESVPPASARPDVQGTLMPPVRDIDACPGRASGNGHEASGRGAKTAKAESAFGRAHVAQLPLEPRRCRFHRLAGTTHVVGAAARAAATGGTLDERLGAARRIAATQVVVFPTQVRARTGTVVPFAVSLERTSGSTERGDQCFDFALGGGGIGGLVRRCTRRFRRRRGRLHRQDDGAGAQAGEDAAHHAERFVSQSWIDAGTSFCARPET